MARLKNMLEPGETMLHRGSALRSVLSTLSAPVAFLPVFLATLFVDSVEEIVAAPVTALPIIGLALLPSVVLIVVMGPMLGLGEACIITGRRILVKRGLFRPRIDEMALADIEVVEIGGSALFIRGGGRTLAIQAHRNGLTAEVMARALPRWFPDAGKPIVKLGRILQPGERLIFRYPSPWFGRVLQGLMLCLALFFLWGGYGELIDGDWRGVLIQTMLAAIMLWLAYAPSGGRHGWYSAVTDRRLLQYFDWDHSRYEEIPLAEIEAEWRSQFGEKLAARHRGENLDVPAKGKDAERVLAAIEAAKGAA